MISFEHNCIQVKVPKTAGTSISAALKCMHVVKPHRDIIEIKEGVELARKLGSLPIKQPLSEDWFNQFFKFGFVRNPWDRVVSLYNRREGQQLSESMTFEEFVGWITYASDTCIHPSRHKNQLDWFADRQGNVLVDFIGKFETLEDDWSLICKRISFNQDLPHLRENLVNKKHYSEYYTSQTRDIIAGKFRVDIEYFEYSFDG